MSDLTKLTADELRVRFDVLRPRMNVPARLVLAEISRRLARLEQCEAALGEITRIPTMPFPDRQAHSERAFANAVWSAWCKIQDAARAALEEECGA